MRRVALAGGVLGALALSAVHWLGLLVGGVVVGVLAKTWPRALAGGLGFGALAWLAFLSLLADAGRLSAYFASGQLLYVSVAIPLALGLVGALAHGVVSRGDTA